MKLGNILTDLKRIQVEFLTLTMTASVLADVPTYSPNPRVVSFS